MGGDRSRAPRHTLSHTCGLILGLDPLSPPSVHLSSPEGDSVMWMDVALMWIAVSLGFLLGCMWAARSGTVGSQWDRGKGPRGYPSSREGP